MYTELDSKLQGRNKQSRKIGNNTYLIRRGENIAIRLHNTDIVIYYPNGKIVLNSGGWRTPTTKDRINSALRHEYRISQDKGIWYIQGKIFQDGLTIENGVITGTGEDRTKENKKFKKKVSKYAQACADAIPIDKPSPGDCWYCLMMTDDKRTLGDAMKDNPDASSYPINTDCMNTDILQKTMS